MQGILKDHLLLGMIAIEPRYRDDAGFIIEEIQRENEAPEFPLYGFMIDVLFVCLSDFYDQALLIVQWKIRGYVFDIMDSQIEQLDLLILPDVGNIVNGVVR